MDCPVCLLEHYKISYNGEMEGPFFDCPTCGRFTITREVNDQLKKIPVEDIRREKLIKFIQDHQQNKELVITVDIYGKGAGIKGTL